MVFEEVKVEIITFEAEDVITASTMGIVKGDVETDSFNWTGLWGN